MRWLWFAAGWLMVALGFIGAMLPVMPTTIFLIMAVGCFARSSPRFERWLLEHPQFGRPLRQWREEGAISRKGRRMAFAGMAAGYVIFWIGARPSWLLALGVGLSLCWVRPTWARGRCRGRSGSPATRAHGSGGRRFPYFSSYFVMEILPLSYSARKTSLASSIPSFLSSAISQSSSLSIISSVLF